MDPKTSTLSSLIGSRICHDLISPIGAINNGLELLNMAGHAESPELSLIGESVDNATARIRFFRIAFGLAGDESLDAAETQTLLKDVQVGGRIRIDWRVPQAQPRQDVRLAFLALMCLETAMAYGGEVGIECDAGQWRVAGSADRLHIEDGLWSTLTQAKPSVEIRPATVQFALLQDGAASAQRTLGVDISDTDLSIRF